MVPKRKRRLQTFSAPKKRPTKVKLKEREQKLISRCLRKQLAWSSVQYRVNSTLKCHDSIWGTTQGSKKLRVYEKRYANVILTRFPGLWVPDTVVLEGTFLINTAPLVTHATMRDYAVFFVKRFITPHLAKGVHIVYDRPVSNLLTPKAFEQRRRDTEHSVSSEHSFNDATPVPQKWREYLHCQHCKQQLVVFLGQSFLLLFSREL